MGHLQRDSGKDLKGFQYWGILGFLTAARRPGQPPGLGRDIRILLSKLLKQFLKNITPDTADTKSMLLAQALGQDGSRFPVARMSQTAAAFALVAELNAVHRFLGHNAFSVSFKF